MKKRDKKERKKEFALARERRRAMRKNRKGT